MMLALDPAFQKDALNLMMAVLLGGVIGFERQWGQRLAGLRTNTLVSLGAAIFVVFATQFDDSGPTGVAAGLTRVRDESTLLVSDVAA